jgi:hypothetical protein
MKRDHSLTKIITALVSSAAMLTCAQAQTVLSGDHVVEGNLEVGTAVQKGGITIKGETGNAASPGIKVTGDGGVLFEGTSGVGVIPTEGAGTRLMWYPKKAAFRVGRVTNDFWNDGSIGQYSVAMGLDSKATGTNCIALSSGEVSGLDSMAASQGAVVSSYYGTGLSGGYLVYGTYSTGLSGGGTAFSDYSTGLSGGEVMEGDHSTAMSGGMTEGHFTVAAGRGAFAYSYGSITVGSFNVSEQSWSRNTWVATDPIFIVGNGSGDSNDPPDVQRRNAFVIQKNGNVEMTAKVKMPRQGDILMGEFGNPEP